MTIFTLLIFIIGKIFMMLSGQGKEYYDVATGKWKRYR